MWSDNETTQDLLGYQVHVDLLKKIILDDGMLPISVGVFGNWGSGKSSLMLLLKDSIDAWVTSQKQDKCPKILQIKFNSWQFEGYDTTKLAMIETILDAIQADISRNKNIFEKADDFFARIKLMKAGVLFLKKTYENLVPEAIQKWMPSQEELDKITGRDEYKAVMDEVSKGNSSKIVESFRNIFEQLIKDIDYKAVIVYVDDLDRCDPTKIIECLEAVKLFVNVDRTAFVIGADERILEYAIKLHYPIEQEKEEISSPFSDYLEKLIQLPYKLPKLSDNEQETYITLLLCKQHLSNNEFTKIYRGYIEFRKRDKYSKYDIEAMKGLDYDVDWKPIEFMLPIVPLMKQFLNGNPRQLKRFLNTLYVRKELANVAGFDEIRPDVLVKLMVLEYNTLYRNRFEELYRLQRNNSGVLDINNAEVQAMTEQGVLDEVWKENWSSEFLKRWLAAKPSLAGIKLQNYFWVSRDALQKERPVASLVTNKINLLYKRLKTIKTDTAMKTRLPGEVANLQDDEKEMLIMLINVDLCSNPASADCWRILNNDADNNIIGSNIDRLKSLFDHVDSDNIDPQAAPFIIRMKNVNDEYKRLIASLSFSNQVKNSILRIENHK